MSNEYDVKAESALQHQNNVGSYFQKVTSYVQFVVFQLALAGIRLVNDTFDDFSCRGRSKIHCEYSEWVSFTLDLSEYWKLQRADSYKWLRFRIYH